MNMNSIDELKAAIDTLDKEMLRDTLAYLLKVYVLDSGLSYEGISAGTADTHRAGEPPVTFADLVRDLKSRYSMEELRFFSIEGGNVFISIDGNRYQLTGNGRKDNTENHPGLKEPDMSASNKSRGSKDFSSSSSSSGRFEKLEME